MLFAKKSVKNFFVSNYYYYFCKSTTQYIFINTHTSIIMNTQMSFTEALGQSGLESIDFVIIFTYIIMLACCVSCALIFFFWRKHMF